MYVQTKDWVVSFISGLPEKIFSWITDVFMNILNPFKFLGDMGGKILNFGKEVGDKLVGFGNDVADQTTKAFNKVTDGVTDVGKKIGGFAEE